jgi:hypothetical protein
MNQPLIHRARRSPRLVGAARCATTPWQHAFRLFDTNVPPLPGKDHFWHIWHIHVPPLPGKSAFGHVWHISGSPSPGFGIPYGGGPSINTRQYVTTWGRREAAGG